MDITYGHNLGQPRAPVSSARHPVYSSRDSLPGVIRLRAGLLSEPVETRPLAHFYVGSRAGWWPINDDLPQFEAAYVPAESKSEAGSR